MAFQPDPASKQSYDIYLLLCVQYLTPDDGQKTFPKHIEFYSKNKFEKLVHLVGFIIRILYMFRTNNCSNHILLGARHPKDAWHNTVCCVYRNNLLMMNNYFLETCGG